MAFEEGVDPLGHTGETCATCRWTTPEGDPLNYITLRRPDILNTLRVPLFDEPFLN